MSPESGPEIHESVLDLIGDTPLVRLSRLEPGLRTPLIAKVEFLNPGGSVKDRPAVAMIDAAEREGVLKPGGTLIEPTSGNTGLGLAMVAALRGYRVIAVMPDKMSREKIDTLRAFGAEVVVCPTAVEPESPQSYYRVADRLTEEIDGGFQPNQYFNQANPEAHYRSTAPGLWRQTGGAITHLVIAVGTGGTITGVGRYLKEQNPDVRGRRRRSRGLDLLGWAGAPVPGRGDRRGLLARELRPRHRRPVRHCERPRLVSRRRAGWWPARGCSRGARPGPRCAQGGGGAGAGRPDGLVAGSFPTAVAPTCPRSSTTPGCGSTAIWATRARSPSGK